MSYTEPESGKGGRAPSLEEMDVTTPTLQWISIESPQDSIPLGENDYVLDSSFNHEYDTWEVLVLLKPDEEQDEDDE